MMDKRWEELILKYNDGADVDDEDDRELNVLDSLGLIHKGISNNQGKITAKTTDLGREIAGLN